MEAFGKGLGGGICVSGQLQVGEKLLQLVGNAVVLTPMDLCIVSIRVDMFTDLGCHKECLYERVHVACGSLVLETNVGGETRV